MVSRPQRLAPTVLAVLAGLIAALTFSAGAQAATVAPVLAAGEGHTCAITAEATLACWGTNDAGQLGTGDRLPRTRATVVPGLTNVTGVATSYDSTCAVSGGRLFCWGGTNGTLFTVLGRFSEGAQPGVATPHEIGGTTDAVDVALTSLEVCVRSAAGALRCLRQSSGRKRERQLVPVRGLPPVLELAAGASHLCARLRGGHVRCWGDRPEVDGEQQATDRRRVPGVDVPGLRRATSLGLSQTNTCAAFADGSVRCLGARPSSSRRLRGITDARRLTGGTMLCALTRSGGLRCLGYDGRTGDHGGAIAATPTLTGVTAAVAVEGRTCALRAGGEALCWGTATRSLGSGQSAVAETAVVVPGLSGIIAIGGAVDHTCAVRADRTVACWGASASGPSGDAAASVPATVAGVTDTASIAASDGTGCAVDTAGAVRCWGATWARFLPGTVLATLPPGTTLDGAPGCFAAAGRGQCLIPYVKPAPDGPTRARVDRPRWLEGATAIARTDSDTTCAVFADRNVTCEVIQEGDPGNYYEPARARIPGLTDATAIAAWYHDACVLQRGGTVACWDGSQFGYEGPKQKPEPAVAVAGLEGATAIAMGDARICAVIALGRVRCAPLPGAGVPADAPRTTVAGVEDARSVTLFGGGGCALIADGTVRCWGDGSDGRLGDGPMPTGHGPQPDPTPVLDFAGPVTALG